MTPFEVVHMSNIHSFGERCLRPWRFLTYYKLYLSIHTPWTKQVCYREDETHDIRIHIETYLRIIPYSIHWKLPSFIENFLSLKTFFSQPLKALDLLKEISFRNGRIMILLDFLNLIPYGLLGPIKLSFLLKHLKWQDANCFSLLIRKVHLA